MKKPQFYSKFYFVLQDFIDYKSVAKYNFFGQTFKQFRTKRHK